MNTTKNEMTDEELRVKVAILLGWKETIKTGDLPGMIEGIPPSGMHCYRPSPGPDPLDPRQWYWIPDWPNDLNACFEFEDELLMNPDKHDKAYLYDMNLLKITGAVDEETGLLKTCFMWHATARQRALAFVKTMEEK